MSSSTADRFAAVLADIQAPVTSKDAAMREQARQYMLDAIALLDSAIAAAQRMVDTAHQLSCPTAQAEQAPQDSSEGQRP